jgi:hypothetical protein
MIRKSFFKGKEVVYHTVLARKLFANIVAQKLLGRKVVLPQQLEGK